jgi:tetratricopeptide (TPR) repeat protein
MLDGEAMRKTAGGRPGRARALDYQNWDALTWNLPASLAAIQADADTNAGVGTGEGSAGILSADIQARLHELDAADLSIRTAKQDQSNPIIDAQIHFVYGLIAKEKGDLAKAVTEMEAFGVAFTTPAVSSNLPGYNCWIALTEELAGHPDKADAALNAVTHRYVDCLRFRGDILNHRGKWANAQKAYTDAVALAPDLPAAYYSWGVALAAHGDLAAAETELREANARGPHWADPLKAWGDVLVKEGKLRAARRRYDEALNYAPNWAALTAARDALDKPKG